MQSNFREKQPINEEDPAEQVHKIWRKNFQELLSNHIFDDGSFFKAAPCIVWSRQKFFLPISTRPIVQYQIVYSTIHEQTRSGTSRVIQFQSFTSRSWSLNLGDRDGRVDLIGSGIVPT